MRIGLIHVGGTLPNVALMHLSWLVPEDALP